jgi:CubicO group peptidase (beta-lactamase class C family)
VNSSKFKRLSAPRHALGRSWVPVLSAMCVSIGWVSWVAASGPLEQQGKPESVQLLRAGDPHAHGVKDEDLDAMRTILRRAVEDQTVPGVSLLLAHRGEIIFKEAFGNLTVDQKVLMASSSKPVTATVVMILADRKKVGLDDPIENYLPEFEGITIKGKPPKNLPTVRHLLCNMSGLPGDFLSESLLRRARNGAAKDKLDAKEKAKAPIDLLSRRNRSLAESVRALAESGLATEPGQEFHYCTMGFNVAARVAEVAAKQPFEEIVRTELLEPLGMKDSRFLGMGLQAMSTRATLPDGQSRFIMAGGGMSSTLDDFAAFYQMHLNGGTYGGRHILSEPATKAMHTRQTNLGLLMSGPYGNDYGLAFFLDRLDAHKVGRVVSHTGLFGTTPWLDKDRELVGVFIVQSNFLRVMALLRDVQAKTRSMFPARHP